MASSRCKDTEIGAPMAVFTKNILLRSIYVENYNIQEFSTSTKKIADETNKIIQELSLMNSGRLFPFISLRVCKSTASLNSARVLLKGLDNDYLEYHESTMYNNQSHLVEFQISAGYRQITFSNISCDAKLVLDENFLHSASIDLFLDISMFNSFSFLRKMTLDEKKRFSREKYSFFKEKKLPCYYTYDDDDELMYYSLAFSAHKKNGGLDLDMYISLWDEFLEKHYKDSVHEEDSIEKQLSKHLYAGQLDMSDILLEFAELPRGDYLLLLTNRKAKGRNFIRINSIFGDGSGHLKAWKIVPVTEYHFFTTLIQQNYIAAFKVVNR